MTCAGEVSLAANICTCLGLDPTVMSDQWTPGLLGAMSDNPMVASFTEAINQSRGFDTWPSVRNIESYPSPFPPPLDIRARGVYTDFQIITKPPPPVDVDAELFKCSQKYGQIVADQLRSIIEENIPLYEYLIENKV